MNSLQKIYKIVKITNISVSTVTRNSVNYNLIGPVECYHCMVTYK